MGGQYPDGLRGPLIVHDPDDPYAGQYDEELVLTTSGRKLIVDIRTKKKNLT